MMKNHCPCCGGPRLNQANVVSLSTVWFTCANCQHVWRSSFLGMAIGSAIGSVGARPAPLQSPNVVDVVKTPKAIDVLTARKVSRTSMALEQSDVEVSNGLGHLERALAVSSRGSDHTDDPDDADAIVEAHLESWSSGFNGSSGSSSASGSKAASESSMPSLSTHRAAARPSPARTFDEQLEGLNAGLAKPASVLQWHSDHEELLEEDNGAWPTVEELNEESAAPLVKEERAASLVEEERTTMPAEFQPLPAPPAIVPLPAPPAIVEDKPFESPLTLSTDRMLRNVDGVCDAFRRLEQQLSGMERLCEELAAH